MNNTTCSIEHGSTDRLGALETDRANRRSHKAKKVSRDSGLIQRPALVDAVTASLERDGLAVFCSDPGLGRHSLAKLVSKSYEEDGVPSKWLRLNVKSDAVALRRISQTVSSCIADDFDPLGDPVSLVVIEGLAIKSEDAAIRLGKQISGALFSGLRFIIILMPEFTYLIDELPRCRVFAAHDLVLSRREIRRWGGKKKGGAADYVAQCTHGIASLVDVMLGPSANSEVGPSSSVWDERVCRLYAEALRPSLIDEELQLRCAMAAFGSGSFEDLSAAGVRVSFDLLADTRGSCPLFGIDLDERTFNCVSVGSDALRELLVTATSSLEDEAGEMGSLLCRIAKRLIAEESYDRAGALLWACPLEEGSVSAVAAYPLELIDAGHLPLVTHVALRAESAKLSSARNILRLLGVPITPVKGAGEERSFALCSSRVMLQTELLESINELVRARPLDEASADVASFAPRVKGCRGCLTEKVYQHYRCLTLWFEGCSLEAFRELMLDRELRGQDKAAPSVFSSVLQCDFEALRRTIGDPISAGESHLLNKALLTLELSRTSAVRGDSLALLELAEVASGQRRELEASSRAMVRWQAAGMTRALAWASLYASLADSAAGQYRRAFVRANQSLDLCEGLAEPDIRGFACMARKAATRGLKEAHIENEALLETFASSCSADVGAAVRAYYAAAAGDDAAVEQVMRQMRTIMPRVDVVAMLALVGTIDGVAGARLAEALPLTWRGKAVAPDQSNKGRRVAKTRFEAQTQPAPVLRIDTFGGITISLGDELVPEAAWRRKQAKLLLAMLALTPGHLMQRHEIISALWPEADLARGREYLYTVLSSLRCSLGQTPMSNQYILGEMGQIRLDTGLVSCDVDEFESMSRRVVNHDASDEEIVSLCVALEGMYAGGSFVPMPDALGRFKRRHDELERRYRDAMLAGAEAATRLRDQRQAAWFTRIAKEIA